MKPQTILANILSSDKKSIISKLLALDFGLRRLENRTRIQNFNDVTQIGLDIATATCRLVKNNMNLNSSMTLAIIGGNYPLMDTPERVDTTGFQSGTLEFIANQVSPGRFTCVFHNENGLWYRYFNDAYATTDARYDSGWIQVTTYGMQQQIVASSLSGKYAGLLSNIKLVGEFFIAGSDLNSSVTDSPYGTSGNPAILIENKRAQLNRGIHQTVRANINGQTGFRRFIDANGAVGGWQPEFIGNSAFTTSSTITSGNTITANAFVANNTSTLRHVNPATTATYNLGGTALTWNNLYIQNAPTVVSDADHKSFITDIPDEVLDAWATVGYSQWKLNTAIAEKGEDEARLHVGIVAQNIRDAFLAVGQDATDYGILVYEEWGDSPEIKYEPALYDEETGELISEEVRPVAAVKAGHIWMVRMEECLAMEAALLRRTTQRLEDRLSSLENK